MTQFGMYKCYTWAIENVLHQYVTLLENSIQCQVAKTQKTSIINQWTRMGFLKGKVYFYVPRQNCYPWSQGT